MDEWGLRGRRARRPGVSRAARPRLLRDGLHGRGPRRAGARAAAGRGTRDHAPADQRGLKSGPPIRLEPALPELASVYWRAPMDAQRLRKRERFWTLTSLAHVFPFLGI